MQTDDTLNIEFWTREYVVRALNKARTILEAAYLLGVNERMIYYYRVRYNIHKNTTGTWYYKETYDTRKLCGTQKTISI